MISDQTLTLEWITRISNENRNADKILIEKSIRALKLLECLVKAGCPLIFKGGTALMLYFNSSRRISIDIDIICPKELQNGDLESFLKDIKRFGFDDYEIYERQTDKDIPKIHAKFYYKPAFVTYSNKEYILLDILFEESIYRRLVELEIDSLFVNQEGEALKVIVPSLEDILGDKLTAFAPNTTGIPYKKKEKSMSMEIIKQLYDVASVFDRVENLEITNYTFHEFCIKELEYRRLNIDHDEVLKDIIRTAWCISVRGKVDPENFKQLQEGIKKVKGFIFSEQYQIERVIVDASKAAYLAKSILVQNNSLVKYRNSSEIKDLIITQDSTLNKLKKTNPEAFFYWYNFFSLDTI